MRQKEKRESGKKERDEREMKERERVGDNDGEKER